MNLYYFSDLVKNLPEFKKLADRLQRNDKVKVKLSLPDQVFSVIAASLYSGLNRPVLFITAHPELARRRFDQVKLWLPVTGTVYFFPENDLLGNMASTDTAVNSERLKILLLLSRYGSESEIDGIKPFILGSALSLASRSMGNADFQSSCLEISNGTRIKQSALLKNMQAMGYEYEEVVEIPGTFGKRGGIVDVFPCGRELPARIEFFGEEIESIREYDPRTQRSGIQLRSLTVPPASDSSADGTANILDYLPNEAILILDDIGQIKAEVVRVAEEMAGLKRADQATDVKKSPSCFSWEEIEARIVRRERVVELSTWELNADAGAEDYQMPLKPAPNFAARFSVFIDKLPELRAENRRLLIVSQQAERISELLLERNIDICPSDSLEQLPRENSLTLFHGSLDSGWQIKDELLVLTDRELFGIVKQRRAAKTRPVRHHWFLNDISVGDLVVHVEHGIGRFAGITKKVSAGVEREYLILEYSGGDTLYVPVDQVDRVSLYIGGSERAPTLSRLGSQEWNRAQQKVKESVANIAGELIALYANREAASGLAFSTDTLWQQELEASFPYIETPDQLDAVAAVKADMQSNRPMDRLVCGDVGYGKTEIALRAAFKAVMDSKQVAILVPTTILAQQHFNTFSERLRSFPVKIAALSRFCSAKEQSETIGNLAAGAIDICIGTHRLLQKDVLFKDLGLVIIDEEQRFGVAHKEHFKKMRQTVDVLTLSATPIPRTMHMALSGIRDMSTIESPPESRLPVITHVGEYNDRLVHEAVLRELERDGQVFIVHNRVHSINELAFRIANLIPEARISIAHGQMEEDKLEKIMADFIEGKSDVLVTTTIIESGLDMPNVNTLIVDNADRLGLTQLYQLRGRVGRGANTAYAYFLFDPGNKMTEQARERLKTISQATELGAGFAIAMKDLEIRGAGNLLGAEQSGNIAAVGFNYYCQLLAEAVEEIRAKRDGREVKRKTEEAAVSIVLQIPAFIPEYYIANTRTRFNIYRRLAKLSSFGEVNDIAEELIDRFGTPPEEVANLLYIVELKQIAQKAGLESIFSSEDMVIVSLDDDSSIESGLPPITRNGAIKIGNRQIKLNTVSAGNNWKKLLKELLQGIADNRFKG